MRSHHVDTMGMNQTVLDPCLFFRKNDGVLSDIQGTLVDDSISTGTTALAELDEKSSRKFECKPKSDKLPVEFRGVELSASGHAIQLSQFEYTGRLEKLYSSSFTSKDFATAREKLAYAVFASRPDLALNVAELSQRKADDSDAKDVKSLNKAISALKEDVPLIFSPLDEAWLTFHGYADAGFAINEDLTSQLGVFVLLKYKHDNACVVHFSS